MTRRRADRALDAGLERIREQFDVPTGFPPPAALAAIQAAARTPGADHVDRTDRPFVTLDPAGSTDLDQAFALERAGDDVVLHYAIADVGFFVDHGDALDAEAWQRGVTVYMPDEQARLYPAALSEGAASLLPDGPRPAVVFTVRVDGAGAARLDGVERAVVRSRAKLAYETVQPADLPAELRELARRDPRRRGRPRRARASSSPSRSSSRSTDAGRCGSIRACRARTSTPACRWPRTSRSPTRCSPPASGCSA